VLISRRCPIEILADKQIVICRHEIRSFLIVAIPPPWVQQTALLAHGLFILDKNYRNLLDSKGDLQI